MTSEFVIRKYEKEVLDREDKQEYGRDIVAHLGAHPGPRGSDDGVDGWFEPEAGDTIYFQVKLSKHKVSRDVIKVLESTCRRRNSRKAIVISVNGLSRVAEKDVEEYKDHLSLCSLKLRDILTGRHYQLLEDAKFAEAQELGSQLSAAFGKPR